MKFTTKYEIDSKDWISQWRIQNFADGGTTLPIVLVTISKKEMHKKRKKKYARGHASLRLGLVDTKKYP